MIPIREIFEAIAKNFAAGGVVGFLVYFLMVLSKEFLKSHLGATKLFGFWKFGGIGIGYGGGLLVGALIARLIWLAYKHPPPLP
jgi:hypothetical protein